MGVGYAWSLNIPRSKSDGSWTEGSGVWFLLGPSDTLDEAFRNPETARADPKPYTPAASVKDFTFVPLTFVA